MPQGYDQADMQRAIDSIADGISSEFSADEPLNIVGIRTRGETFASRLTAALVAQGFGKIGRGVLDITLYRDDLSEIGPIPLVRPTRMEIIVDAVPMVLVDDVLFTGRTVRAALNALTDFGRPKVIRLAVLADRGGRELPIRADYVGVDVGPLSSDRKVCVRFTEIDGIDGITIEPRQCP
jgi:pyrimidine operon attenuation protein/uracil phosphoribosyltransferase